MIGILGPPGPPSKEAVARERHLFLDLEDTIISPADGGWHSCELINVEPIRQFIERWQATAVHVFSFAISVEKDLEGFNRHVRERLERALGRSLEKVPLVDRDIKPISIEMRCKGLQAAELSFTEMTNFWGKEETFRFCCRHWFGRQFLQRRVETDVLLLDDCTITEFWQVPALRLNGGTLDVAEIL